VITVVAKMLYFRSQILVAWHNFVLEDKEMAEELSHLKKFNRDWRWLLAAKLNDLQNRPTAQATVGFLLEAGNLKAGDWTGSSFTGIAILHEGNPLFCFCVFSARTPPKKRCPSADTKKKKTQKRCAGFQVHWGS
jgi:hypothetical protein